MSIKSATLGIPSLKLLAAKAVGENPIKESDRTKVPAEILNLGNLFRIYSKDRANLLASPIFTCAQHLVEIDDERYSQIVQMSFYDGYLYAKDPNPKTKDTFDALVETLFEKYTKSGIFLKIIVNAAKNQFVQTIQNLKHFGIEIEGFCMDLATLVISQKTLENVSFCVRYCSPETPIEDIRLLFCKILKNENIDQYRRSLHLIHDAENMDDIIKIINEEKSIRSFFESNGIDVSNSDQATAFITNVVNKESVNAMKFLIKNGADVNASFLGLSLLHVFLNEKNHEMIRFLKGNGVDIYVRDLRGCSFITFYLGANKKMDFDSSILEVLLEGLSNDEKKHLIDSSDMQQVTPLMRAVMKKNIPAIRFLKDNGADETLADSKGKTAIDYAEDNAEILEILRS